MGVYKVWSEDDYGELEEDADEFELKGLDALWGAEVAAEEWAEKQDHSDGYPDGSKVMVRELETNRLYIVNIQTDFTPTFICDGKLAEYVNGRLKDDEDE